MTTQSENVQLRLNTKRDEITIRTEGKIYVVSSDYLMNSDLIRKAIEDQIRLDIKNEKLNWAEV